MNNKKRFVVITTINYPTIGVQKVEELCNVNGWSLVVVGDQKTPSNWSCGSAIYLSPIRQQELFPELSSALPWNHYCRKNLGYLYSIQNGAEEILETDDDNIPYPTFGSDIENHNWFKVESKERWINVYGHFGQPRIWPRGNPLSEIRTYGLSVELDSLSNNSIGVIQYLADKDPDVDAIARLLYEEDFYFQSSKALILDELNWCSFNSQNTLISMPLFSALYLPSFVSFRMTDIWRSFVMQALLKKKHLTLVFTSPTVYQVRNEHNLMTDFSDEVIGYLNNDEIISAIQVFIDSSTNLDDESFVHGLYSVFYKKGFFCEQEMSIIKIWMESLNA